MGPSESVSRHYAYPNPVPRLLATPLVIHEKNWKCLDVQATGFPVALQEHFHQPNSTNSCSQSGKSCNSSLCTSSSSLFLFVFGFYWFLQRGFPVTLHSYFHFFRLFFFFLTTTRVDSSVPTSVERSRLRRGREKLQKKKKSSQLQTP